jgi:NitT/TauT family transport system substrate-binding protein
MKKLRTSLIVPVLAFGMMAIGSQGSSAAGLVKWREGIVPFKGDAGFFYMAEEKGFFRKHGIDLEFVQIPGNVKLVRALIAGAVDAIEASPGAMLKAIERGADVQFIGSTLPGLTYAFYVTKGINSWSDLKGKTIGASARGSVPDIFARVALKNHGIDTSSINIHNAGGSSGTRIKAVSRGQIAAGAASTEFVPIAEKLNIKVLTTAAKEAPLYPRLVIASTGKILNSKDKKTVAEFLAGYMEGLQYAVAHRQETIDLTAKLLHNPAGMPTYAYLFDEVIAEKAVSPTAEIPRKRLEWLENYMVQNGLLKEKIDLDKHIDVSYREEALKMLKQFKSNATK